jgi:hypothetical protein
MLRDFNGFSFFFFFEKSLVVSVRPLNDALGWLSSSWACVLSPFLRQPASFPCPALSLPTAADPPWPPPHRLRLQPRPQFPPRLPEATSQGSFFSPLLPLISIRCWFSFPLAKLGADSSLLCFWRNRCDGALLCLLPNMKFLCVSFVWTIFRFCATLQARRGNPVGFPRYLFYLL